MLVRLLTENETVAFHSRAATYLFFENSVYSRIPATGLNKHFPLVKSAIFCLIDVDQEKLPDIDFMTDIGCVGETFPVMASPMPPRYCTWGKQRGSVPLVLMPLWERNELKKG